jgi:hypothetical protein
MNKCVLLIGLVLVTLPLPAQVKKPAGEPATVAGDQSLFHDSHFLLTNYIPEGLATDPAPTVAQHALNDLHVDHRLTVLMQAPLRRTLSDLHANIQDVFNANGVQIMGPHYMADADPAKVVPPERRDPGIRVP